MDTEGLNAAAIEKLAKDLAAKAIEMRKAERKAKFEAARAKERAENEKHYSEMFSEIGEPVAGLNKEQHAAVYAMAWEHGHSSGFHEVQSYYEDFSELARKIIAAN